MSSLKERKTKSTHEFHFLISESIVLYIRHCLSEYSLLRTYQTLKLLLWIVLDIHRLNKTSDLRLLSQNKQLNYNRTCKVVNDVWGTTNYSALILKKLSLIISVLVIEFLFWIPPFTLSPYRSFKSPIYLVMC